MAGFQATRASATIRNTLYAVETPSFETELSVDAPQLAITRNSRIDPVLRTCFIRDITERERAGLSLEGQGSRFWIELKKGYV